MSAAADKINFSKFKSFSRQPKTTSVCQIILCFVRYISMVKCNMWFYAIFWPFSARSSALVYQVWILEVLLGGDCWWRKFFVFTFLYRGSRWKKLKFSKSTKSLLDNIFTLMYQSLWLLDVSLLSYCWWQMDEWTDGYWSIEVCAPPKYSII